MTERETYIGDDDLISKFMCKEPDRCKDGCDCEFQKPAKKQKLNHGTAIVRLDPKPISFRSYLASAYGFYEEEKLIQLECKQPLTHIRTLTEGSKKKQSAQGDKLMLKLKQLLDYVPRSYKNWERSKMQKIFHRNFMQATCMHLYRNDPDIDMDKIMKMNGFDNLKQQVLCLTPRRFGKSTSVAMANFSSLIRYLTVG